MTHSIILSSLYRNPLGSRMVEITLPIMLQIIQTVSISVGIIYYLFIMRNVQKSRQRENLLLRFQILGKTYNDAKEDFLEQDWGSTMEDYSKHSPESRANFNFIQSSLNNIGVMMKEKLIDPEMFYQIYSPRLIMRHWETIEDIINNYREITKDTKYNEAFEYLYNDAKKRFPDIISRRDRQPIS